MGSAIRSYVAECIGTFTLVLVGTAVATLSGYLEVDSAVAWLGISAAFGGALLVLVIVIGPVSGCHVNPAVTLGAAVAGRTPWLNVPGYLIGQCVGAIAASALLLWLMGTLPDYQLATHGLGANAAPESLGIQPRGLFVWEVVLTALFVMVILAATRPEANAAVACLGIGGFLFLAHLIGVPMGDASLNPARSLGPAVFVGGAALKSLWLFVTAPILGGILGVGVYRAIYDR